MLRPTVAILLICAAVVAQHEIVNDNRPRPRLCGRQQARQPIPIQIIPRPEPQPVYRPRICVISGSFIGDDYWTSIGYDGLIRDGRSRADFLIFDQINNGYIAYWITRTKYGNTHYEAFGHAFVRDDGRICAWFVGLEKEIVEVCGGFRILSRSRYNPAEPIPFEWVPASPQYGPKDTLGFHDHRIAKHSWEGENFYGDARLKDRNFQGVSPSSEQFVEVSEPFDFERKIWILRRKPDAPVPERTKNYPEISTDPRDNTNIKYADPHVKEDRLIPRVIARDPLPHRPEIRTQEIRQPERTVHIAPSQNREPPRPYAPADDRDPRYYDPRYWFDRRNWRWINGDWKYEPGNYEYFTSDPQIPDPNDPRYRETRVRPEAGQDPRAHDSYWKRRNPSFPQAERVPGDNEGWHVVGESAPSEPRHQIGQGVYPERQAPHNIPSQEGQEVPPASDPRQGYYTDPYGRQLPIRTREPESKAQEEQLDPYGRPIGEGVRPNQQEVVSFPNGGNGETHTAKMHRPTIVKDEFGTVYKPVVIDGQKHYISENQESQEVKPNPQLANIERGEQLDKEQWERQEEAMKKNEEERKKQEEKMKENEEKMKEEEEKLDEMIKEKEANDEEKEKVEADSQVSAEESVPLEEEETSDVEEPAKLPPPREENAEEMEENEDDEA